jgi:hypothetical protein
MSDVSPQSGPQRTLMIQIAFANRDFMSTRPNLPPRVSKKSTAKRHREAATAAIAMLVERFPRCFAIKHRIT